MLLYTFSCRLEVKFEMILIFKKTPFLLFFIIIIIISQLKLLNHKKNKKGQITDGLPRD